MFGRFLGDLDIKMVAIGNQIEAMTDTDRGRRWWALRRRTLPGEGVTSSANGACARHARQLLLRQQASYPIALGDVASASFFHSRQKRSRRLNRCRVTAAFFGFEACDEPLLPFNALLGMRKMTLGMRKHFTKAAVVDWAFHHLLCGAGDRV